jgi:hypothetical protein
MQKNYCIVGLGSRGISMYATDLLTTYADVARLTGLCDHNEGRVQLARAYLHTDAPGYTDFDRMLDEVPCDVVIVTTQDSAHDEYIIRAMRRGKDVITEKPMTIDERRCRAILAAQRELASTEGVFCEPASAASVAGLLAYPPAPGSRVVCVLTGHGLKDPDAVTWEAAPPVVVAPELGAVAEAVGVALD